MTSTEIFRPAQSAPESGTSILRAAALLVLISLAMFLPGFVSLQPMDRDEPRFAQATKQMLETGDFVAIRFQDEARNKKPVGIYWMQAGVVSLAEKLGVPQARQQIFLYRLPSLLGAIATVLLTYWAALALVGERAAFMAALMLASCILLGVEARLAKTDAVIAATVAAAMGVLARHFLRPATANPQDSGWRLPAIFWTAMGIGLLVKGPITPMVPGLATFSLLIWTRSAQWLRGLRPIVGVLWCLAIVAPWFVIIMIATKGAFLTDSVGQDMLGKVASGQEAHGAPPGSYLATFLAVGWPFAPLAALAAPFVWRARREPAVAFLLAWLVPSWLIFEAVPTKLPHYVLPLYPAIAILAALAMERGALALSNVWSRALLWFIPTIAVVLTLAGAVGWIVFDKPPGWVWFIIAPLVLWQAWRVGSAIRARTFEKLPMAAALLAFLTFLGAYGGVMTGPVFAPLAMSPRLVAARAAALAKTPNCPALPTASAGFSEPSLIFLTETNISMTTPEGAAAFLQAGPCRLAFVDARVEPAFRAALGERADVRVASRVEGFNLNGGRRLDIGLYVRQGGVP